MVRDRTAHRLPVLLALTFALTVLSFLVARAVSERLADGTDAAVATITDDTLPSNDYLGTVRNDLRSTDALLREIQIPFASPPANTRDELLRDRKHMGEAWGLYMALPFSPGERDIAVAADTGMRRMNASVDRILADLARGDRGTATAEINDTRASIAEIDGLTEAIATLNRQIAAASADRIAQLRASSRWWGLVLDCVSALLALVAAYFVVRVARVAWVQSAQRAAEIEHFAGRVAHDIRSPLGAVSVAMELAKRRSENDPTTASILARGMSTVERIAQFVDGLLVFAAAGRPFAGDRGANARSVVDGVVEDARASADQNEIAIEVVEPSASLTVACSPGVLASLLSNVLVNAIQYMGDAPVRRIVVRIVELGGSARFEVADTGPGIPAALRTTLFDPVARPTGSSSDGLSLGLATVRRLVEAHEGTVGVEPNVGGGSLVWFEVPKWNERRDSAARRALLPFGARRPHEARGVS